MTNQISIAGRLTKDVDIRFTQSGSAVASFTVAYNKRKFDKQTNQWVDGDTTFLDIDAWKQLGEGAAESLTKGTPVIVVGELVQETWEKNGEKRSRMKLVASEIGASVRAKKTSTSGSFVPQQTEEMPW